MRCCKCLQRCGQMMCCECYKTIKELNEQKKKIIVEKKQEVQNELSTLKQLSQSFERQLSVQKRKVVLLAKIKEYHNRIKMKTQRNIQRLRKKQQLSSQLKRIEQNMKEIKIKNQQIQSKIEQAKKNVRLTKQQEVQIKQQIINIIQNKFRETIKYITFDQLQTLEEGLWNHYVIEEGLENMQNSISKPEEHQMAQLQTQTTNIVSILGDFDKSKQKILKYFERSIKIVKILSHLYSIQLPYRIKSAEFKSRLSLKRAIFNQNHQKKFNYALLRKHQANTIYLYSRACMTVFYPDIEQGRLQDLHEAMINRLKGYSMRPMSSELRKIPFMKQLATESLVQHFYSNTTEKEQNFKLFREEQEEVQESYIGIVDFNVEDQQEEDVIELLI